MWYVEYCVFLNVYSCIMFAFTIYAIQLNTPKTVGRCSFLQHIDRPPSSGAERCCCTLAISTQRSKKRVRPPRPSRVICRDNDRTRVCAELTRFRLGNNDVTLRQPITCCPRELHKHRPIEWCPLRAARRTLGKYQTVRSFSYTKYSNDL